MAVGTTLQIVLAIRMNYCSQITSLECKMSLCSIIACMHAVRIKTCKKYHSYYTSSVVAIIASYREQQQQ